MSCKLVRIVSVVRSFMCKSRKSKGIHDSKHAFKSKYYTSPNAINTVSSKTVYGFNGLLIWTLPL